MASRDINVVALVKGSERYVFLYDDDSRKHCTLNRYAADPKLSFSWYDVRLGTKSSPKQVSFKKRRCSSRVDRRTS